MGGDQLRGLGDVLAVRDHDLDVGEDFLAQRVLACAVQLGELPGRKDEADPGEADAAESHMNRAPRFPLQVLRRAHAPLWNFSPVL